MTTGIYVIHLHHGDGVTHDSGSLEDGLSIVRNVLIDGVEHNLPIIFDEVIVDNKKLDTCREIYEGIPNFKPIKYARDKYEYLNNCIITKDIRRLGIEKLIILGFHKNLCVRWGISDAVVRHKKPVVTSKDLFFGLTDDKEIHNQMSLYKICKICTLWGNYKMLIKQEIHKLPVSF